MKSIVAIKTTIRDLETKIDKVKCETADKQAQAEGLKKSNAKLVELNLGKQRRSASLEVHRKKIFEAACQIDELKYLQGTLEDKLKKAKEDLHDATIRKRIHDYQRVEAVLLGKIQKAQDLLAQYIDTISKIEMHMGDSHPLYQLIRILEGLNGKSLSDFGVDLGAVLKKFQQARLFFDLDLIRIENLNIESQNFEIQLEALRDGKRWYHSVPKKVKESRVVSPLHRADRLKEYGVELQR